MVTINTKKGLFQYTCLPFGIAPAPAKFQKIIDTLLEGLEGTAALLDDIIIGGKDISKLKERMIRLLNLLANDGLTISDKICEVGKSSLDF